MDRITSQNIKLRLISFKFLFNPYFCQYAFWSSDVRPSRHWQPMFAFHPVRHAAKMTLLFASASLLLPITSAHAETDVEDAQSNGVDATLTTITIAGAADNGHILREFALTRFPQGDPVQGL